MKLRFLALLSFLFFALGSKAEQKNIASEIKHVTVYPTGATISRETKVSIRQGSSTLRFYGISTTIDPNSIQLEADGDYIVQSIAYKYDYLSPVKEPKVLKLLADSLVMLRDELTELNGETYAYNQELQFIVNNKTIGGQQVVSQSEEFEKISAIIRSRVLAIKKALFSISLKERTINQKINRVNNRMLEIRGNSPKPQGIVEIQILAERPISGDFKLVYFVRNAGWRPVYDLKFTEVNEAVSAKYNAYVKQSTGVAWEDVRLTLSTSNPAQSNVKPVLHPWYLYFKNPRDYLIKNRAVLDSYKYEEAIEEKEIADADMGGFKAKTAANFTATIESVLALDFEVSLPYKIPSDGQERVINLKKMEIPSTYTYYTAPKIEKEAFLVANMTDWANMQLLPGAANIFMGNTFMGASYLNPGIGSDTIEIAFGRDKMVQVDRQLLSRECKKSRLAGKQRHNLEYEITVRNLHKSEIELVIQDQIPVSNIKEIEIELNSKDYATHEEKSGILTWEVNLEPGKSIKKKFSFQVKHPRDKVVYPLNYM
ncbi:MAG: DUF4139 domain-containing protein [Bacteroidia bacterium]